MKRWLVKKLIGALMTVVDSWGADWLTEANGLASRRWIEDHTIMKVRKWNGKSKHWAKLRSDNQFVVFMVALMKSNRLTEFKDDK
jgi:hypothetical protein